MNESLYWHLPYEMRRRAFKRSQPKRYAKFEALRTELPERPHKPTLMPFLERECIFLHVPKAAGMSVNYSLFGRATGKHFQFHEFQAAFDRHEWRKFYTFTFVRNPYDRLVSAFLFLQTGGSNRGDKAWGEKHLHRFEDFNQFVHEWVNEDNVETGRIHFLPQDRWLGPPTATTPQIDFVGRFENLADDYERLRAELGFGEALRFDNKTKAVKKDFRSYYDDRSIEIVSRVYRREIDMLGYTFDA